MDYAALFLGKVIIYIAMLAVICIVTLVFLLLLNGLLCTLLKIRFVRMLEKRFYAIHRKISLREFLNAVIDNSDSIPFKYTTKTKYGVFTYMRKPKFFTPNLAREFKALAEYGIITQQTLLDYSYIPYWGGLEHFRNWAKNCPEIWGNTEGHLVGGELAYKAYGLNAPDDLTNESAKNYLINLANNLSGEVK